MNTIKHKLERALELLSYPPLHHPGAYRRIAESRFNTSWRVKTAGGETLILRFWKTPVAEAAQTESVVFQSEFPAIGLFYKIQRSLGHNFGPLEYRYTSGGERPCTLESYTAPAADLSAMTEADAQTLGNRIAAAMHAMHNYPHGIQGFGPLVWNGLEFTGANPVTGTQWQREQLSVCLRALKALRAAEPALPYHRLRRTLMDNFEELTPCLAPGPALVNAYVLPDALPARRGQFAGFSNVRPLLDEGMHYAARFVFLYTRRLKQLAELPLYRGYKLDKARAVMTALARGFTDTFGTLNPRFTRFLEFQLFLWSLKACAGDLQYVGVHPDRHIRQYFGTAQQISKRISSGISKLSIFALESV